MHHRGCNPKQAERVSSSEAGSGAEINGGIEQNPAYWVVFEMNPTSPYSAFVSHGVSDTIRDMEVCGLLVKYLLDNIHNIKNGVAIRQIADHIELKHLHAEHSATTILSVSDMKLKFGGNSCDSIDLHHPDSFPEIAKTLKMCLRYKCAFCRRHWSAFPGLKKRKP